MELSRDDHQAMHAQARERSIREIVATLDAHVDDGDGWCAAAWHSGEPRRHPCGIRYHFEGVLDGLRRQA